MTDNPPIPIYINKIEKSTTLSKKYNIKTEYYLILYYLLMSQTIKLLGGKK